MLNIKQAHKYCYESIELIQGFKEASESAEMYHVHHRFEDMGLSRKDLIELGLLYNRPACELMFIDGKEHNHRHSTYDLSEAYLKSLYQKGHIPKFTEAHRSHISEAKKGVKQSAEHTANVIKACKEIRASKEFRERLRNIQETIWTPEQRKKQSATIKHIWETNDAFRNTLKQKASKSIHKDLEAYKQYKANGGTLSWKPFRSWLAQQRKCK